MGSPNESRLKKAKSQNLQYFSYENLNFDGPGPPKTGPERVQNWFPIASSTRKPSKSFLRASWSALGGSWSRKKVVGVALGPSWGALGVGKPPNINLAIMEREAGEARECHALQEEQQTQPRQEKQDHMYAQPLFSWRSRIGHSHARCARALGRLELGASHFISVAACSW